MTWRSVPMEINFFMLSASFKACEGKFRTHSLRDMRFHLPKHKHPNYFLADGQTLHGTLRSGHVDLQERRGEDYRDVVRRHFVDVRLDCNICEKTVHIYHIRYKQYDILTYMKNIYNGCIGKRESYLKTSTIRFCTEVVNKYDTKPEAVIRHEHDNPRKQEEYNR